MVTDIMGHPVPCLICFSIFTFCSELKNTIEDLFAAHALICIKTKLCLRQIYLD